jgi:transcriptional regulator GlxA family with amidase domain
MTIIIGEVLEGVKQTVTGSYAMDPQVGEPPNPSYRRQTTSGRDMGMGIGTTRRELIEVVIVALPSAGLMNIFGPAEVFARANAFSREPIYRVKIVSAAAQGYETDIDMIFSVNTTYTDFKGEIDTLLLAGGNAPRVPMIGGECGRLPEWLRANCAQARRFGALGSGGMLLAEAGLLNHKRVTTHWSQTKEMAGRFPSVRVLSDRIYVKDGNCYTAAGGTSAIDLALLMVEEDLGSEVTLEVAKQIVLFLRRSGEQPQLSTTLLAQTAPLASINNLLIWMADHLDRDLSVVKLARRVAMSPRNFARIFQREVGKTPARHVSDLRLEAARRNLAEKSLSLAEVARASGFGSVEGFRRVFTKTFGVSPGRYREVPRGRMVA